MKAKLQSKMKRNLLANNKLIISKFDHVRKSAREGKGKEDYLRKNAFTLLGERQALETVIK